MANTLLTWDSTVLRKMTSWWQIESQEIALGHEAEDLAFPLG